MTKLKATHCGDCGGLLTDEERAYPFIPPHDEEPVCTDCEYENYHFRCPLCDEYELVTEAKIRLIAVLIHA